jgi:hypothetical protein
VNLGNTLDVVSNPIKGLVLEGGEGFVKGLFGDKNGRKQYDYNEYIDTGSGVADFVLSLAAEIVSDPLNWISFGGKAAVKFGVGVETVRVWCVIGRIPSIKIENAYFIPALAERPVNGGYNA